MRDPKLRQRVAPALDAGKILRERLDLFAEGLDARQTVEAESLAQFRRRIASERLRGGLAEEMEGRLGHQHEFQAAVAGRRRQELPDAMQKPVRQHPGHGNQGRAAANAQARLVEPGRGPVRQLPLRRLDAFLRVAGSAAHRSRAIEHLARSAIDGGGGFLRSRFLVGGVRDFHAFGRRSARDSRPDPALAHVPVQRRELDAGSARNLPQARAFGEQTLRRGFLLLADRRRAASLDMLREFAPAAGPKGMHQIPHVPFGDPERLGEIMEVGAKSCEPRDRQVPRANVVLVMGVDGHGIVPVQDFPIPALVGEAGAADHGGLRRHDIHRLHGGSPLELLEIVF